MEMDLLQILIPKYSPDPATSSTSSFAKLVIDVEEKKLLKILTIRKEASIMEIDLLQIMPKYSPDSSFAKLVIDVELSLLLHAPQGDNDTGIDLEKSLISDEILELQTIQSNTELALIDLNSSYPEETESYGCNCRNSKCMKLYCDCFAAEAYCGETCSCIDCFNKPVHEDVLMASRKQIESRNPFAFAPKVIKSSDSVPETETERGTGDDASKTKSLASARHKLGCNCRKSKCLMKYCECYKGGVSCSRNCRCQGCKNTFGTRDG